MPSHFFPRATCWVSSSLWLLPSERRAAWHGLWGPLSPSCPGRVAGTHSRDVLLAASFARGHGRVGQPSVDWVTSCHNAGHLEFKPNMFGELMASGGRRTWRQSRTGQWRDWSWDAWRPRRELAWEQGLPGLRGKEIHLPRGGFSSGVGSAPQILAPASSPLPLPRPPSCPSSHVPLCDLK